VKIVVVATSNLIKAALDAGVAHYVALSAT